LLHSPRLAKTVLQAGTRST